MMIYINILYNGPYVCNFKIPLPFLPKLEGLGWIRETNFHPYWTHFDSTIRPRRLINEMFELNIYLSSESQFSAIIVIIGSISMNNSFQLKLNNLSFLESVSYLVRPHSAPIDLDSIRLSSFDCTTNLTAPSSVFQLGNRKLQLRFLWDWTK